MGNGICFTVWTKEICQSEDGREHISLVWMMMTGILAGSEREADRQSFADVTH